VALNLKPVSVFREYGVETSNAAELMFGPFRFYPLQRILLRDGTPLRLGSRAREILLALVEQAGEVVKKRELIERVWPDTIVEEGTLRVHIAALRKALGEGQAGMRYVENLTGRGYRFAAPVMRVEQGRSAEFGHTATAEPPHRFRTTMDGACASVGRSGRNDRR
jgi:DNA-binding winged helix-turn-helix (wHTH) protein